MSNKQINKFEPKKREKREGKEREKRGLFETLCMFHFDGDYYYCGSGILSE